MCENQKNRETMEVTDIFTFRYRIHSLLSRADARKSADIIYRI